MRLNLISCEIFHREICQAISRSPNQVDVRFLPKGLHDLGQKGMQAKLDEVLKEVDEDNYEAILLGYGLCNNGIVNLSSEKIPIVVPRAHDCITLFLGDKDRYLKYFHDNPGTYFLTSGWIERGAASGELKQLSIQNQYGLGQSLEELVEKYGEDNAKFIYEQLSINTHYKQYAYIEMGIEPDNRFEVFGKKEAEKHGWVFDHVKGDMSLIYQLVDGQWDEDKFLVVEPGQMIKTSFNPDLIIESGSNN